MDFGREQYKILNIKSGKIINDDTKIPNGGIILKTKIVKLITIGLPAG